MAVRREIAANRLEEIVLAIAIDRLRRLLPLEAYFGQIIVEQRRSELVAPDGLNGRIADLDFLAV